MADKNNFDEEMDLKGVPCPANSARVLLKLEIMDEGEVLRVLIDDGEAYANVPPSVIEEGYEILSEKRCGEGWELQIKA